MFAMPLHDSKYFLKACLLNGQQSFFAHFLENIFDMTLHEANNFQQINCVANKYFICLPVSVTLGNQFFFNFVHKHKCSVLYVAIKSVKKIIYSENG